MNRVEQITLLFPERLVSMAKFDEEHESFNRFYVWWRLIPLKFKIQNGRQNDVICKENG